MATPAAAALSTCNTWTWNNKPPGAMPQSADKSGIVTGRTRPLTGTATPTWSIESGELPPGISFDGANGDLGDFPTAGGTYPFTVRAEDGAMFGEKAYSIVVVEPNLAADDVANQLLGATGTLSADEERFLDLLGNNNGTYDVGDFRAYVIDQGLLNTSLRGTQ